MRISSKSILSPGRGGVRDPPNSLTTSLSRKLRNSGSVKGGASPAMFPTTAKKRGSFENPEPSSPKVTCIGQVRVKSKKKQAKKLRTLSRRHSTGEISFRKLDHPLNGFPSKAQNHHESLNLESKGTQNQHQIQNQNQNQECSPAQRSWVHFPVTICDALRTFGSEFSCLFPCRTERGKEEKTVAAEGGHRQGSCGAVFARWLVAVQDGDGGGQRDIELVVGDDDEEEKSFRKTRRHVFEDLEIINDRIEGFQKDEARVSICIPPKNALLLMRCRSDPMKIEALTNRTWEPNVSKYDEEEDEQLVEQEDHIEEDLKKPQENLEAEQQQVMVLDQAQENVQEDEAIQGQEQENVQQDEANQDHEQDNVQQNEANQDHEYDNVQLDMVQDQVHGNVLEFDVGREQEQIADEEENLYIASLFEEFVNHDQEFQEQNVADFNMEEAHEVDVAKNGAKASTMVIESAKISETHVEEMVKEADEHDNGVVERENEFKEERESERVLPECLLMMMYEPKLSMEVSKETWVCSTDFIRRHPNRGKPPPPPPPVKPDGGDELSVTSPVNNVMRVTDSGLPPVLLQPARSSCSLPVAPSMATVLEQKLANAVGYEPFVLTRCKSEPMKTAAAKLLPESCVWENRKVERLSRVTFGVGAAGLGF